MICARTRNAAIITEDISQYMADIEGFKRISTQREIELSNLMQNGTEAEKAAAREELICANLKLVVKIAHDFKRYNMTFADIVAEGNKGLMVAADKFRPGMGAKFSCYATWWIKQSIRKALAEQTHTIRIPGGATQRVLNLEKAKTSFQNENYREPTEIELVEITGLSEKQLENTKRADLRVYSLEAQISEDDPRKTTFGSMIEDDMDDESPEKEKLDTAIASLRELMAGLSDRDQFILKATYGIEHEILDEVTLSQETGLPLTKLHVRILRLHSQLKDSLLAKGVAA